ncbi:MAG: Nif11-like leader peptide family RiPP precursor [Oscillospiraceae bacterium]|nr:Nif11-like leader peptide family RiPP precursor [Oscillospiraceae bacterium]
MENKLTPELIEKARQAKSPEELLALAKENGMTLTQDEAREYFSELHGQSPKTGELSDDELDNVSGGGCYTDDGQLVVTPVYGCKRFVTCENIEMPHQCFFCRYCDTKGLRTVCVHPDNYKKK